MHDATERMGLRQYVLLWAQGMRRPLGDSLPTRPSCRVMDCEAGSRGEACGIE